MIFLFSASDKILSHKFYSFFKEIEFLMHEKSPKTYNPNRALEKATQIRFSMLTKPILLSLFDRTKEISIMSFSSP